MGCSSGAVTKKQFSIESVTIDIRYSSACDAFWARATVQTFDPTCAFFVNIIQFTSGSITARQRLVGDHAMACLGQTSWTYMIADKPANDHYNACGQFGFFSQPESPGEGDLCTGRF